MRGQTGVGALMAFALALLAVAVGRVDPHVTDARTPADFIVDSGRDAGPDSLRDAILAADRLSSGARIVIRVRRIEIDSALPPLLNPHGIAIEAAPGDGVLDAAAQTSGATLQINSPDSTLQGLTIVHARLAGVVVNAPGVQLDSLRVANSSVGVLIHPAAHGVVIRTSTFQSNATAVQVEAGAQDIAILSSILRGSSRAGLWFVGAAPTVSSSERPGDVATSPAAALRVIDSVFDANASGMVVGNQSVWVQKSRFLTSAMSGFLLLGGSVNLQDSQFQGSGGAALSLADGRHVVVLHNTFADNRSTAVLVRDSDAVIDGNTVAHDGVGIVAITERGAALTQIRNNLITRCTADAISVIGGSTYVHSNRALDNRGAGIRILDLLDGRTRVKATPQLGTNVLQGNAVDMPPIGIYHVSGAAHE